MFCRLKRQLFIWRLANQTQAVLLQFKYCRLKRQLFIRRLSNPIKQYYSDSSFVVLNDNCSFGVYQIQSSSTTQVHVLSFKTTIVHLAFT